MRPDDNTGMKRALLASQTLTAEAAFCQAAAQVLSAPLLEAVLHAMDCERRAPAHDRHNLRCALMALRATAGATLGATPRARDLR